MKKILLQLAGFTIGASSLFGLTANINYGSAPAAGGALFQGEDGQSADSIAIGYFSGTANAALTGWTAIQTDTDFNTTTGFNIGATGSGADVTAANGLDAWILVLDGSLSGLIRATDWAAFSGATAPTPDPTLTFQLDSNDSTSTIQSLSAANTTFTVTNNGGQGGSGIGIQLTAVAVPEPSTFAALAGLCALGAVMVRRRRA